MEVQRCGIRQLTVTGELSAAFFHRPLLTFGYQLFRYPPVTVFFIYTDTFQISNRTGLTTFHIIVTQTAQRRADNLPIRTF